MNPHRFSDAIDQRQFHEIKQLIEGTADAGDTIDGVANSVSWKTVVEESPQLGKIPRAEVAGIPFITRFMQFPAGTTFAHALDD
ncbi:MAG: hypothetical protein JNJ50_15760 [Acidobacteria bacterium]|nr:hypothetical protein [Acidobacteriota bacterium]